MSKEKDLLEILSSYTGDGYADNTSVTFDRIDIPLSSIYFLMNEAYKRGC